MPISPTPGTQRNPAGNTFQDWMEKFLSWATWKWASSAPGSPERESFLGNSWNTARFGTPDPTATIVTDPTTGQQIVTGQNPAITKSALMAFAQAYQGGDPEIDSAVGPFVPQGQNDFVPTAAQANQNQQQQNWQATFARQQKIDEINQQIEENKLKLGYAEIGSQEAQNAANNIASLERAKIAAQASVYGTQVGGAADIFGSQMSGYGAQLGALSDIYGTQGSMYNAGLGANANIFGTLSDYAKAQEALRQGSYNDAGGLALGLQGLKDARTENYVRLSANPGNFIERELAGRAIQGTPDGSYTGPMYQDDPSLAQALSQLLNFQAAAGPTPPASYGQTPTQPVAPTMPAPPVAPTLPPPPALSSFSGSGTPVQQSYNHPNTAGTPPTQPNLPTTGTNPGAPSPNRFSYSVPAVSSGAPPMQIYQDPNDPHRRLPVNQTPYGGVGNEPLMPFAAGSDGLTREPMMMAGDVQQSGQPNPEAIVNPTGAPVGVMNRDEISGLIQELTMELQQAQSPEEQQEVQGLIQQLTNILNQLNSGTQPEAGGMEQPMSDIPEYAQGMLSRYAYGSGYFSGNPKPDPISRPKPSPITSPKPSPIFGPTPSPIKPMPITRPKPDPITFPTPIYKSPPTTFPKPNPISGPSPFPIQIQPQPIQIGQPKLSQDPYSLIRALPMLSRFRNMSRYAYGTSPAPDNEKQFTENTVGEIPSYGTREQWNANPANLGKAYAGDIAQFNAATSAYGPHTYVNWQDPSGSWDRAYGESVKNMNAARSSGDTSSSWYNPNMGGLMSMAGAPGQAYAPPPSAMGISATTPPPITTQPISGTIGGSATPPPLGITTHSDEVYQNQPLLQYLRDPNYKPTFNTLAQGNSLGAFGMQIPEAGAINYGTLLDIIKNHPQGAQMLQSILQSSSRDLNNELSLSRMRAPLGSGIFSSRIRTM